MDGTFPRSTFVRLLHPKAGFSRVGNSCRRRVPANQVQINIVAPSAYAAVREVFRQKIFGPKYISAAPFSLIRCLYVRFIVEGNRFALPTWEQATEER
jgi:hypothetical protein